MDTKEMAKSYLKKFNLSVIPIQGGSKIPVIQTWKGYQERKPSVEDVDSWYDNFPDAGVAIITGEISGIIVLDIDGEVGKSSIAGKDLPITPTVKTGKGMHYYFKYPNFPVGNKIKVLPGIDIKGDGGYVVAPPSVHPNGSQYKWEIGLDTALANLPDWVINLCKPIGTHSNFCDDLQGRCLSGVDQGERNTTAARLAGKFIAEGLSDDEVLGRLLEWNQKNRPPLDEKELVSVVHSIRQADERNKPLKIDSFPRTDSGNAERLVARSGRDLHYLPVEEVWLVWDGKRWARDDTRGVERLALATVRGIRDEADAITEEKERIKLGIWSYISEGITRRKAMVELAKSIVPVPITPAQLDQDLYGLNLLNGTLDLRSGQLRTHRREDLITRLAPVKFDPGAKSELWEKFLSRVLPDTETRAFVQRAAGYTLLGHCEEERLFFPYGPPATGKSTFLLAILSVLGDYGATADFEVFLNSRYASGGRPRPDLVRLLTKRMVVSLEIEEGRAMAEALVAQLTGGDRVAARGMYQRSSVEVTPQCKLWLAANRRPKIPAGNSPLWRRILQIPFEQQIPEAEREPKVKRELSNPERHGSAILNWLIEGCLAYQEEGLNPPQAVKNLTEEYRREMDPLADFLEECCVIEENAEVPKGELYRLYVAWHEQNGNKKDVMSVKRFNALMRENGFTEYQQTTGTLTKMWRGIRLSFNVITAQSYENLAQFEEGEKC